MIEKLMSELIEALNANTEATLASNEIKSAALEKAASLSGGKKPAAKPSKPAKAEEPEEEEEVEEEPKKPAAKKPAAKKPAAKKTTKPKPVPFDKLKAAFGNFINFPEADLEEVEDETEEDFQERYEEEKENRTDFVVSLFEEFGVKKITELDKDDYPRAMELLQKKIDGEDVNFGEDADEDDDPLG